MTMRYIFFFLPEPTYRNTRLVGKYISTKMVGSDEREDLTHLYKYAEGSPQERKAFETAYSFGAGAVEWEGHFNVMAEGKDLTLGMDIILIIPKNLELSRF